MTAALAVRPSAAPRLNAPPTDAPYGHNRPPGQPFTCRECGGPEHAHAPHGAFCSTTCRLRWNNRRLQRGAVVYDLLMALRYQRGLSKAMHVWRVLCRLAADFRAEDREEREGRQSWREPKEVIQQRPYLTGKTWRRR